MTRLLFLLLICITSSFSVVAQKRDYYEIKVYNLTSAEQEKTVEDFLKQAYVPALHRAGIKLVGVFKPIAEDTINAGKKIFVLIPLRSLDHAVTLAKTLEKDNTFQEQGKSYHNAPYDKLPYARMESIFLESFKFHPQLAKPVHATPASERIYELRSYESHTEKIYKNKVHMFNEGDEIGLFKRLGFNAVFYGDVVAGSHMPNLMYMTSFENREAREAHWKTFVADPQWKKLSSMPEYQHNVSRIDIYLLHPTEYSDL